jgi:flagellar biosynthesis protein FliQ
MERLAALAVAGLRVGVAIDGLQCPLGILKLHLCVFLPLVVHLLLALPLAGRRTILALLLHLFVKLFRELLDLPTL